MAVKSWGCREEPREWIIPQSVLVTPSEDLVIWLEIWVEDLDIDGCPVPYLQMPVGALQLESPVQQRMVNNFLDLESIADSNYALENNKRASSRGTIVEYPNMYNDKSNPKVSSSTESGCE